MRVADPRGPDDDRRRAVSTRSPGTCVTGSWNNCRRDGPTTDPPVARGWYPKAAALPRPSCTARSVNLIKRHDARKACARRGLVAGAVSENDANSAYFGGRQFAWNIGDKERIGGGDAQRGQDRAVA